MAIDSDAQQRPRRVGQVADHCAEGVNDRQSLFLYLRGAIIPSKQRIPSDAFRVLPHTEHAGELSVVPDTVWIPSLSAPYPCVQVNQLLGDSIQHSASQ